MSSDNYLLRTKSIVFILSIFSFAAWGLLALTTCVFSSAYSSNFSIEILGYKSWWITGGGVLLFFLMIDIYNGSLVEKVIYERKDLNNDTTDRTIKNIIWFVMCFFVLARIGVTTTTSLWAIDETSKLLVAAPDDKYYFDLAAGKKEERDRWINDLEKEKANLISTKVDRIISAQKEKQSLILGAESSGDIWQKVALKEGGVYKCWMCSNANKSDKKDVAYCNSIKSAYVKGDSLIRAEEVKINDVTDRINQLNGNGDYSIAIKEFEQLGIKEKQNHESSVSNISSILWIIEPLSAFVGVICSLLIALIGIAGNERRSKESLLLVVSEYRTLKHDELVGKIRRKLEIAELEIKTGEDIDGDGGVGTVGGETMEEIIEEIKAEHPVSQNLNIEQKKVTARMPIQAPPLPVLPTATTHVGIELEAVGGNAPTVVEDKITTVGEPTVVVSNEFPTAPPTAPPTVVQPLDIVIVEGLKYAKWNGINRDYTWMKKLLSAYIAKKKDKIKRNRTYDNEDMRISQITTVLQLLAE